MELDNDPIKHFEQQLSLARAVRDLPAEVHEHFYSYASFGSWTTVLRHKGTRIRIGFDGREASYFVERSRSRKPPDDWGERRWLDPDGDSIPVREILDAIADCVKSG